MKNILLILVLANVLYFVWGWYSAEEKEPGAAIIKESDLGEPLELAPKPDAEALARVAIILGLDEESGMPGLIGRACVTIGPFNDADVAKDAQRRYAGTMHTVMRTEPSQIFLGHWVQIRDVPSREDSNRMIRELKEGGLEDAYPVETDDEGRKISLGLFGNLESAEKVELEAQSLGFDADISPRLRDGEVHFVDLELPPGKGAGEMIERYGPAQVGLRADATCPPDL